MHHVHGLKRPISKQRAHPQVVQVTRARTSIVTRTVTTATGGNGLLASNSGSVAFQPTSNAPILFVAVRIRAPKAGGTVGAITVIGATVVAWHPSNETAWFKHDQGFLSFSFTAVTSAI